MDTHEGLRESAVRVSPAPDRAAREPAALRETLRQAVCAAGFVRARFLAPFAPAALAPAVPANYRTGAPALVVAALAYGNAAAAPAPAALPLGSVSIAPFAQRNYYREAVKRFQAVARVFRAWFPRSAKADYRILCNSPVPEKPLAAACGLGAVGRNGLIITPEAGSLVIIGAMTLPVALEPDPPLPAFAYCAGCDPVCPPCVAACPTGALGTTAVSDTLDRRRCIQWYASGHDVPGGPPPEVRQHWGARLYGCTACQDPCVHNRRPIPGTPSAEGPLPPWLDGAALQGLDDAALTARFRGTCLGRSWLTPAAIRANLHRAGVVRP